MGVGICMPDRLTSASQGAPEVTPDGGCHTHGRIACVCSHTARHAFCQRWGKCLRSWRRPAHSLAVPTTHQVLHVQYISQFNLSLRGIQSPPPPQHPGRVPRVHR